MHNFELVLEFSPAFHRHCTIQIEGIGDGIAKFEAYPIGLLPGVELAIPVDDAHIALLHDSCTSMLSAWDEQWKQCGLDGISISGVFDSTASSPHAFSLWSPRYGSAAHAMLATALDCFPVEQCDGTAGEILDIIRSYFELQPPATIINKHPLCLRLAPWIHARDAEEIKGILKKLPREGALVVDASRIERFGMVITRILPIAQLLQREEEVRWRVSEDMVDVLVQFGIKPSAIEVIRSIPISNGGQPIVLGGILVPLDMVPLAKSGNKKELVQAFRKEFPLTMEQAARAATELMEILIRYQVPE